MNVKTRQTMVILAILFLLGGMALSLLWGENGLIVRLRFYEGMRSVLPEPQHVVISSYLGPLVSASIPSGFTTVEEKKQIKKVFNFIDVRILTEADVGWGPREFKPMNYVLRFDSREIQVVIAPVPVDLRNRFRIEVYEQVEVEKVILLDTEIILPRKNIAVFGFESTDGTPYFLSFHVQPPEVRTIERPEVKVGGVVGGIVGGGAVRAIGEIKPPRLVKSIDPVYPEIARQSGIEGIVVLEMETDIYGNVIRVQVLRSVPFLDQAATEAVRQWKYEPMIIDGQPRRVIFTVTVSFVPK